MVHEYLFVLFLVPFIAALALIGSARYTSLVIFFTSAALIGASVFACLSFDASSHVFSASYLDAPFLVADGVLCGYFAYVGWQNRNWPILILSLLQLGLLTFLESFPAAAGYDIVVNRLSLFMFLVINIAGSAILVYTLCYIRNETDNPFKQRVFLALLCAFLGIMNLLVSTDNLEWLFLFFELTTLMSFWLIGFRRNDESLQNARTALWMNQIAGVSLLLSVLVAKASLGSVYLSELVSSEGELLMLFAALFSVAALIKGAQPPFSGWLLGAMVAPAPVSAVLHSSTMVKIAPYLLLKISPVLALTMMGWVIALVGALSFLFSAAQALREDNFKKILAHSTISLLGLMILTAALATPMSILASLLLIISHGISKALLFMCAGILEQRYSIKSIESVYGLIRRAPLLTALIVFGFFSITLPPFGVFFAKWLIYEGGGGIGGITTAILLLPIAVGSVTLSLLYFKTLGRFIAEGNEAFGQEDIRYLVPAMALGLLLLFGSLFIAPVIGWGFRETASFVVMSPVPVWGDLGGVILPFGKIAFWHIAAALFLLVIAPIAAASVRLRGVDTAPPYSCAERIPTDAYAFYYSPLRKIETTLNLLSLGLFFLIIAAGMFRL